MSPQKKRPKTKTDIVCKGAKDGSHADGGVERNQQRSPGGEEEWENLKRLTRQQLEFAGWIDEVETQCRRIAADAAVVGGDSPTVRHAQLLHGVRETMLRSVPDHIKARVLKDIKDKLLEVRADAE
jgi:hypothetical protein